MISKETKVLCFIFLIINYTISNYLYRLVGKADFYPFYDWNLFSYTPDTVRLPIIKIKRINKTNYENTYYPFPIENTIKPKNVNDIFGSMRIILNSLNKEDYKLEKPKTSIERYLFPEIKEFSYDFGYVDIHLRSAIINNKLPPFQKKLQFTSEPL